MKKKAIALGVLAVLAGTAAAQSNLTLYGKIDVGYGVSNGGKAEGAPGHEGKFQQWGGARNTSRWGIKGSEDLGNGLKAYFGLEQGFQPESGKPMRDGFDRGAYVGLSGGFGSIQAGRQNTVMYNVLGQFDVSGTPGLTSATVNSGLSAITQALGYGRQVEFDAWGNPHVVDGSGFGNSLTRADSVLAYISPDFSGFSFQAAVILKNDNAFAIDNSVAYPDPVWGMTLPRYAQAKNMYSVGATYTHGGLTVAAAYESKPFSSPGTSIGASWGLAAKYDFGSFQLAGGYFDNHYESDGKGFYMSVKVPVGALTLGAQVGYNTDAVAGLESQYTWAPNTGVSGAGLWDINNWSAYQSYTDKEVKPVAWELFALYNLSKRTQLYVQYGGINNDAKAYLAASRKYSFGLGMIHDF